MNGKKRESTVSQAEKDIRPKLVIISGGFDPIHVGHVQYIRYARRIAGRVGKVLVVLNTDEWLTRKKGKPFMTFDERKRIVGALAHVNYVEKALDEDETVCANIQDIYDRYLENFDIVFANGGDRERENTPEVELCKNLGIKLQWGVGGGKEQSSSSLLKKWNED